MSLEHALLVSLRERPGSGIELARRFDRSIGFFWQATHQQIYRVLRRMEVDGWVRGEVGDSRSTERRWSVTATGREELARWIATPTDAVSLRSEVAVKMRGASYADRAALLDHLRGLRLEHQARLAHYEQLEREQFPDPPGPGRERGPAQGADHEHALDVWLVLRGGIRQERFWVEWLGEYLQAWEPDPTDAGTTRSDRHQRAGTP
ncbi:DNA-binding transcriptional regulator, PadR family [Nocardioides scoriae]|uniref:DNA-binding transcriptional regulator, PadR family n=1 Tax=Nocardioides scoriae TaxID=642780 RepID=A0A1H1W0M3_9ACTN|nr:PadR family transcriptional regulator [Nocardioides scoriae]SDS90593.1 DNA-binding transcriptional regulator, PadR family [Nocardioides scoriae]